MKLVILTIFIALSFNIFAVEYKTYDMETVKEFSVTYKEENTEALGILRGDGYSGLVGPSIYFEDKQLYITDIHNKRTIQLNQDFSFSQVSNNKYLYGDSFLFYNNFLISYVNHSNLTISNNKEVISNIYVHPSINNSITILRDFKSVFYHSNILFIHDKNYKLWSIKNPGTDPLENRKNLLNQEETLKLFKDGDIDGLTIDTENRLFLDGELQTVNFATYHLYYKSLQPEGTWMSEFKEINASEEASDNMTYIGTDLSHNSYWANGYDSIAVFRPNGILFEFFLYDMDKSNTTPTVSPDGDIYFMERTKDKVLLHRIKRQW